MDYRKLITKIVLLVLIFSISLWLFFDEEAAQPGALSYSHAENAACEDCHVPWRGVSNDMCLGCHDPEETAQAKPKLRFHETGWRCLECHTEHQSRITAMDHTLLNGDLLCSQCHLDPHDGLFGAECRECHGIRTWNIPAFRHPPADRGNCNRCHRPPFSHTDPHLWSLIQKEHEETAGRRLESPGDCRRCHVTHDWRHQRMKHVLAEDGKNGKEE